MSTCSIEILLDKLRYAIYSIVISNRKEDCLMTKAQQTLREDIEKITDDAIIEKVRIFIMGILTQQSISENQHPPAKRLM
jgi:hypothetical protein